jgi:hypothetical protein
MPHIDAMKNATKAQVGAALSTVMALSEAIRGLGQIPSGHLYAQAMNRMSLETYETVIEILIGADLVKRDSSHMLTWIGPKLDGK